MVTYYTFIAEKNTLSLLSHFYRVQVGTNALAQNAVKKLRFYAVANNYYFSKRDRKDDLFRLNVASSLGVKVYELPTMTIKVNDLLSYLLEHNCLPWKQDVTFNLHFLKQKSDVNYLFLCNTKCLKRGTL